MKRQLTKSQAQELLKGSKINLGLTAANFVPKFNKIFDVDIKTPDAVFMFIDSKGNAVFGNSPAEYMLSSFKQVDPWSIINADIIVDKESFEVGSVVKVNGSHLVLVGDNNSFKLIIDITRKSAYFNAFSLKLDDYSDVKKATEEEVNLFWDILFKEDKAGMFNFKFPFF